MPGAWFQVSAVPGDGPGVAPDARSLAADSRHSTSMIRLLNIEKSFPQADGRLYVLRRISLDVASGDFVTIMGPSGAGKSTLLAVLGMLDGDWTGEYRLLEHDVHTLKHKDRIALGKRYVGFVFQQYHLIDDLTGAENLDEVILDRKSTRLNSSH